MRTLVVLLVAADPLGLARRWPRRPAVGLAVGGLLSVAAVLGDRALDLLDLERESFWIAAGIVLLVPAVARLGRGITGDVAGPAPVLVAMALTTRDGTGETLAAIVAVTGAVLLASYVVRDAPWVSVAERCVGAAMVVIALDLVRDGVMAV